MNRRQVITTLAGAAVAPSALLGARVPASKSAKHHRPPNDFWALASFDEPMTPGILPRLWAVSGRGVMVVRHWGEVEGLEPRPVLLFAYRFGIDHHKMTVLGDPREPGRTWGLDGTPLMWHEWWVHWTGYEPFVRVSDAWSGLDELVFPGNLVIPLGNKRAIVLRNGEWNTGKQRSPAVLVDSHESLEKVRRD